MDLSASQKVTLKTNFGASFKPKDWLNIGGSIETEGSLEVKSSYASTAIVYLMPGDTAVPKIDYTIRTQHKLVDHYVTSGWDANTTRADGKWDQAADLALQPQDIAPGWIVTRSGGNNPTPTS